MASTTAEAVNDLSQILASLTSNDNAVRSAAEQRLNEQWIAQHPDVTLLGLAQLGQHAPEDHTRSFAILLLRRISYKPHPSQQVQQEPVAVWDYISANARKEIQNQLLVCLSSETSSPVRHKICDTIAEVAKNNYLKGQNWPELLQALFECIKSPKADLRESAYRIFAVVPDLLAEQSIGTVSQSFAASLQDENTAVRLAALKSAVALLLELDTQKRNQLAAVMPQMVQVLQPFAASKDEESLVDGLEVLIELAEFLPKVFKPVLSALLDFAVSIMSNKTDFEDRTRQSALELLVCLAESAPGMCKKTPGFTDKVVPVALEMMTEIEDDRDWYNVDELGDEDSQENYTVGETAMDRLSRALGGKAMAAVCFTIITQLLASHQWNQRHAGLMAISAIGEGCYAVMENQLATVVQMILPFLQDQNGRVRWAACNAVGQLSTDFAPQVQQVYHQQILSALVPCLDAIQQRVQAHAAAALVNFCEVADKAVLDPYLDGIFERLVSLLNSSKRYVQEQVIMTIATVADSAQDRFVKYYSQMMPILIRILKEANAKEYRMLKGKAMECVSFIAIAVGKSIFSKDAQEVINILVECQASVTESDDPQVPYLLSAWARICKVLGSDFLPFMPVVMPPLMASAKLKPDFAVLDSDEDAENKYSAEDDWEFVSVEGQKIGIKTTVLEEKCTAVEMMTAYAQALGGSFQPYIEPVLEVVLPLLKFYFHDGVREAAAVLLPLLVSCAKQANAAPEYMKQLWGVIAVKLLEVMSSEVEKHFLQTAFASFADCVEIIDKDALTAEQMQTFTKGTAEQIEDFYQNLKQRAEKRTAADYDPEDEEAMEEDEATEEMVLSEMSRGFHAIFQKAGNAFLPYFEQLIPLINKMWADSNAASRNWAICLVDDMIEFCTPEASWPYAQQFLEKLHGSITDSGSDPRQAAAYGAGICARFGGPEYAEACSHFLQPLLAVINDPESRSEDNAFATDNCIAAIAKIIKFKGDSGKFDVNALVPVWVGTLPILKDGDEVVVVYGLLLELIEKQHPAAIQDPRRLFDILTSAIASKLLKGQIEKQVVAAAKHVVGLAPDPNALLGSIPAERRQALQDAGFA